MKEKKFNDTVKGLTIFVESKKNNNLKNIFLRDDSSNLESSTIIAKSGYVIKKDGYDFLILFDGMVQKEKVKNNGVKESKISTINFTKTEINLLTKDRISFLEDRIAKLNEQLPPLEEFILPGGDEFCSRIHVLRAVCRRVERYCVEVMEEGLKIRYWLLYLNRLSDYFFVLSRYYSLEDGEDEILWNRNK